MSAGGLIGRAERPRWVWPLLGLATLLCAGTVASLAAAMDGADWGWLTVVVAAFMGLLLGLGVGIWFQDHRWQALGRRLGEHAED
jgi:hypothetical protein